MAARLPLPCQVGGSDVAGLPVAIAFLIRHGVAAELLEEATRIALTCNVPPDEALIRSGLASEAEVYAALACELGLPFRSGELNVHALARFPEACLSGLAPLAAEAMGGDLSYAYAPRGADFADLVARRRPATCRLVIVTPGDLRRSVMVARAEPIAAKAADGLRRAFPALSARESLNAPQCFAGLAVVLILGLCAVFWPAATRLYLMGACGLAFLGIAALRLASVGERAHPTASPHLPREGDRDLPVYTVLVPLYREARVLPRLVAGFSAFDYPALCS